MSRPDATLSNSQTEYTARWPLTVRKEFLFSLPVTDATTAYTAKQKASRIERASMFSIASLFSPPGDLGRRAYVDGSASRTSFRPGTGFLPRSLRAWLPSSFGAWLRTWMRISLVLCWREKRRPDLIFRRREPARCP